jgi:hypothetical protein
VTGGTLGTTAPTTAAPAAHSAPLCVLPLYQAWPGCAFRKFLIGSGIARSTEYVDVLDGTLATRAKQQETGQRLAQLRRAQSESLRTAIRMAAGLIPLPDGAMAQPLGLSDPCWPQKVLRRIGGSLAYFGLQKAPSDRLVRAVWAEERKKAGST